MGPTEWLLLDVGGTFIKCSDSRLVPVDSGGDREGISAALRSAVLPVCRAADEGKSPGGYGIAVAVPGPFDYGKGIFLMRHKFLSVYGESFRSLAGVPDEVVLRFAHDVNSMLRGEICQGNGRYGSRVALVTLGTGLGFALSIDGTILENSLGAPLISVYNMPCSGGILEDYVSKRGIMALFASKGREAGSVKEIAESARSGNRDAMEVFSRIGTILACALKDILDEYRIETLLFGGQISRSFQLMESSLREGLASLSCLEHIGTISDFENATFNGLRCLEV